MVQQIVSLPDSAIYSMINRADVSVSVAISDTEDINVVQGVGFILVTRFCLMLLLNLWSALQSYGIIAAFHHGEYAVSTLIRIVYSYLECYVFNVTYQSFASYNLYSWDTWTAVNRPSPCPARMCIVVMWFILQDS